MIERLIDIGLETWHLWLEMGIYLVFGFAVAGVLSRLLKRETIARHLGADSFASVAKASLFGVPLPLCSCGVIPVGLSLHNRGASRGATTAFLISTPQTGVDSIAATWAFLGPVFALVRPVAALLNGLLGGGAVTWFERNGGQEAESEESGASAGSCAKADEADGPVSLGRHAVAAFRYGFLDFPREIVNWLLVGIVAAGVIAHLLPDPSDAGQQQLIEQYLGTGFMPMLVMAVVGIPLYICATASVPIVAVLVAKGGLSAGAALVFLMTGPATNVASLLLIGRTLGRRTAAIYLASIVLTSFGCGLLLDLAYGASGVSLPEQAREQGMNEMMPGWVMMAGAVGLGIIVVSGLAGNFLAWRTARRRASVALPSGGAQLRVTGMTCSNCAEHVRKAAESVEGVEGARVDLKAGVLHVGGAAPDLGAIAAAVEAGGYKVENE